jgi:hypothetical protein
MVPFTIGSKAISMSLFEGHDAGLRTTSSSPSRFTPPEETFICRMIILSELVKFMKWLSMFLKVFQSYRKTGTAIIKELSHVLQLSYSKI